MSLLCLFGIHDWDGSKCKRCAKNRALCLTVIEGCPNVTALASTADGRVITGSGADDCNVRVWDPKSGICERVLKGHSDWVQALTVTPTGRVVSASRDFTLRVWNWQSDSCEMVLRGHENYVNALAQLPGERIASADGGGAIRIWNLSSGLCERVIVTGHSWPITALAVVGDLTLVSGSHCPVLGSAMASVVAELGGKPKHVSPIPDEDDCIKVWDTATGRCVRTLHRQESLHANHGWFLGVTSDGKLVSIGRSARSKQSKSIRIWDLATGHYETAVGQLNDSVDSFLVTRDNRAVIVCGDLTVWDLSSGRRQMTITGRDRMAHAVAIDGQGRIISGHISGVLRIWDIGGLQAKLAISSRQSEPAEKDSPTHDLQKTEIRCPKCGHVQREGEWEAQMDKRAKAQGLRGFVNLSAPPQCVKCEAALDGSGAKDQASEKEVSGVCDICNQATSTGKGGKVVKNREMKQATDRGFNGMAIGPNAAMLAAVGISKSETFGQWKQKVMLDMTDWLLCPECQKEIRRYT